MLVRVNTNPEEHTPKKFKTEPMVGWTLTSLSQDVLNLIYVSCNPLAVWNVCTNFITRNQFLSNVLSYRV